MRVRPKLLFVLTYLFLASSLVTLVLHFGMFVRPSGFSISLIVISSVCFSSVFVTLLHLRDVRVEAVFLSVFLG